MKALVDPRLPLAQRADNLLEPELLRCAVRLNVLSDRAGHRLLDGHAEVAARLTLGDEHGAIVGSLLL
eukprot:1652555-Prymnesium_polylepis.1